MEIAAAETEGANPCQALLDLFIGQPRPQVMIDIKWAMDHIELGGGVFGLQGRGQDFMVKRQGCLDQAGSAGSGLGMADAGFDRT